MSSSVVDHPKSYGERKLHTMLARWRGAVGEAVRRHGQRDWPGVPPTALVGLTASATGTDEIGPAPDYVRGVYGVERKNVRALVDDAAEFLGRDVSAACARKTDGYLIDVEAQVVTGLRNYRRHFDNMREGTDASLWTDLASSWALRAAVASYSSGPGITRAVIAHYTPRLLEVPEGLRWPHLGDLLARETERKIGRYSIRGKWKCAFLVLRAEGRAEAGAQLDEEVQLNNGPWFGCWSTSRNDLVVTLQRRAGGA